MPSKRNFRRLWFNDAIREKLRMEFDRLSGVGFGWSCDFPTPTVDQPGVPMRGDARLNAEDFWLPEPGVPAKYRMRFGWGVEPHVEMTTYGGIRVTFWRDQSAGFSLCYPCEGVMLWRQWTKTKEADGVKRYGRFTEESIDAGRRTSSLLHWLATPIIKAGGLRDAVDLHD